MRGQRVEYRLPRVKPGVSSKESTNPEACLTNEGQGVEFTVCIGEKTL